MGPPRGAAGAGRLGAGQREELAARSRADRAGPLVHRPSLIAPGPAHHRPHRPPARQTERSVRIRRREPRVGCGTAEIDRGAATTHIADGVAIAGPHPIARGPAFEAFVRNAANPYAGQQGRASAREERLRGGFPVKVLVTGGAGFIGANLCGVLVERGADVVVVDDLSTGQRANLDESEVELRIGSILDSDLVADACRDVSSIVHLAAVPSVPKSLADPRRSHDINVTGTVNVLEAARVVGAHVVIASSSAVYGNDPVLPKTEDMAAAPASPYAVSKLAAESYGLVYQSCFGVPGTA